MVNERNDVEALVNEHFVSRYLCVSVATVRRWRLLDTGPRYIRVSGAAVRYRPEDLRSYLDTRPVGGGKISSGR